jgi:hypothetical protein
LGLVDMLRAALRWTRRPSVRVRTSRDQKADGWANHGHISASRRSFTEDVKWTLSWPSCLTGLPITQGVQSGILIGLTPIGELRALIGDREGGASGDCPFLL